MNKSREDYIKDFHKAFALHIDLEPSIDILKLRRKLIEEEIIELFADIDTAIEHLEHEEKVPRELFVNMLKELADVQVVLSGTSVALKPLKHLEKAFICVCTSNMSKLGHDGKPLYREDGKVLKGPNYVPPDLTDLIEY